MSRRWRNDGSLIGIRRGRLRGPVGDGRRPDRPDHRVDRPAEAPGDEHSTGERDRGRGQRTADQESAGHDRRTASSASIGRAGSSSSSLERRLEGRPAGGQERPREVRLAAGDRRAAAARRRARRGAGRGAPRSGTRDGPGSARQTAGPRSNAGPDPGACRGGRGGLRGRGRRRIDSRYRSTRSASISCSSALGFAHHQRRPPRSRATARRPRWMRTRTAPSDLPRIPAISAVDISSTKRRISARRRSSGNRATAAQAAPASWRSPTSRLDVDRSGDAGSRLDRRDRVAPAAAPDVRDDVAGDLEEPDPERRGAVAVDRPGALLEAVQGAEGEHERPLGGVLRVVVAAELVVGVAVHLGQVLPIQGVERLGVAQGGLDERSIAVEMDKSTLLATACPAILLRLHPPEHRPSHGVTPGPAGGGAGSRRSGSSARRRLPRASSITRPPEPTSTPEGPRLEGAAVGQLEADRPAARQLAAGPVGHVEMPVAEGDRARLDPVDERREEGRQVDRPAIRGDGQAGHRARPARPESRPRPNRRSGRCR